MSSQQHCSCLLAGHLLGVRVAKARWAEQQQSVRMGSFGKRNLQKGIKIQLRGSWVKGCWKTLWVQVTLDRQPRTLIFGLLINQQADSSRNP